MNPQTGWQQRESFTKAQWKNYDFTMFWSRIIISRCITVKWYLRVYWLLPFRIVDSFGKHRRLFFIAPTNTWASQSTSFPKGVFSLFQRTHFVFINWNSRQLGRSHIESTDTCQQDPPNIVDKTLMPSPGVLLDPTKICACAIGEGVSKRQSPFHKIEGSFWKWNWLNYQRNPGGWMKNRQWDNISTNCFRTTNLDFFTISSHKNCSIQFIVIILPYK